MDLNTKHPASFISSLPGWWWWRVFDTTLTCCLSDDLKPPASSFSVFFLNYYYFYFFKDCRMACPEKSKCNMHFVKMGKKINHRLLFFDSFVLSRVSFAVFIFPLDSVLAYLSFLVWWIHCLFDAFKKGALIKDLRMLNELKWKTKNGNRKQRLHENRKLQSISFCRLFHSNAHVLKCEVHLKRKLLRGAEWLHFLCTKKKERKKEKREGEIRIGAKSVLYLP